SLSLPRYMAIIHPLRPRLSAFATKVLIGVIWLLAVVLAFPFFYFSEVADSHGRFICYISFPKDDHGTKLMANCVHLCATPKVFTLSISLLAFKTNVIGLILNCQGWYSDRVFGGVNTHLASIKVVKMMIVVVCTFAICWLPYHVYFLVYEIDSELFQWKYIQQVYLAVFWLAMSCSMYNPIIYCCLNNR
uniref:Tachykinin receptor 1 n=1 Tax=Petromyzon marinus TaxID=7757 RepID=S4R5F0_PETMA